MAQVRMVDRAADAVGGRRRSRRRSHVVGSIKGQIDWETAWDSRGLRRTSQPGSQRWGYHCHLRVETEADQRV